MLPQFSEEGLKDALNKSIFFSGISPKFKQLNNAIYDAEFVNFNRNTILSLKLHINLSNYEKEIKKDGYQIYSYYDDTIFVEVNFDKCKIGSIKFVFNILKPIETPVLIKLLDETCKIIDKPIFNLFKKDLNHVGIKSEKLTEHITYSIVSGDKLIEDSYPWNKKRELFGIAWNNPNYMEIDAKIVTGVLENNIPIYNDDTFLITTQSTLMLFPTNELEEYVKNRIGAIELFWRQKCLIKKIDFQISELLRNISKPDEHDFESDIKKINDTQKILNSELEVYRNTVVSVTHTYTILFETLNNVFKMDNHYSFVKAKMEACKRIYQQLYDKKQSIYEKERKDLMYNIQWAVFILGILALVSTVVVGVYSDELKNPNVRITFVLVLVLISIIGILLYYYKKDGIKKNNN